MEDATWEDTAVIKQQIPSLILKDKDPLQPGGDDKQMRHTNPSSKPSIRLEGYAWTHAA